MVLKSEIEKAYWDQQNKIKKEHQHVLRYKQRSISLNDNHIQVISGIRRCGKSTLMHHLLKNYQHIAYFNFEDPRIINFDIHDFSKLDEIIPSKVEAYFFDEIQNIAQWEVYIRQLHDNGNKVFITGSNASLLSKELGTRLTGRYLKTELFPFSYSEFLTFEKMEASSKSLELYLKKGGFPEFLKSKNIEILHNLLKDIVLRDVAIRHQIKSVKSLMDITLYLLSNIGKETSATRLKNNFQIGSTHTVIDFLGWLEDAYLFFFLPKFSYSAKSISINPKKVYAIDNGFIDANSLSFSEDKGRILENAVYIHLRNQGNTLYYFKEKNECDFILFDQGKCKMVLQVCHEVHVDNQEREFNGLIEAMNFFNLDTGTIITHSQKDNFRIKDKSIMLIPAYEFFIDL
jgi:predicted AAA+ superfamily ATPase